MSRPIFIIEDDEVMQSCLATATGQPENCQLFSNAVEAISAIDATPPALIFLDILLDGPDGFTFLHELASYSDLSQIPIVLVTSLELKTKHLKDYGVVAILDKSTMKPQEIQHYVETYA